MLEMSSFLPSRHTVILPHFHEFKHQNVDLQLRLSHFMSFSEHYFQGPYKKHMHMYVTNFMEKCIHMEVICAEFVVLFSALALVISLSSRQLFPRMEVPLFQCNKTKSFQYTRYLLPYLLTMIN